MYSLLPDSCGEITKIFVHQTYLYTNGNQIGNDIVTDFLIKNRELGGKIELAVLSTYTNELEKKFLMNEYDRWLELVDDGKRIELQVSQSAERSLPYAQDIGIINVHPPLSAIMSKSSRVKDVPNLVNSISTLFSLCGFDIIQNELDYNLEGGYIYATKDLCLFSHDADSEIIKEFDQKGIFVDNIVGDLVSGLMEIINPGMMSHSIPTHVDLMFSVYESDDFLDVFFVDFTESLKLEPSFWGEREEYLVVRLLKSYSTKVKLVIEEISNSTSKEVREHQMPGRIGIEKIYFQGRIANALYLYSGANLLFNSINGETFAYYLHLPSDFDDVGTVNNAIEHELKGANITPIPISREEENLNLFEIQNSAGLRCIIKVLERKEI